MKYLFISLTFLATVRYFAQSTLEWGEAYKREGVIEEFHWLNDQSYFAPLVYKSISDKMDKLLSELMRMSYYDDLTFKASEAANKKDGDEQFTVEKITCLNQTPIVFLSKEEGKLNGLYYQLYTDKCIPIGSPRILFQHERKNILSITQNEFNFAFSKNREFLAIRTDEKDEDYEYYIYTKSMELVSKGTFKPERGYIIKKLELTDQGELYCLLSPRELPDLVIENKKIALPRYITCLSDQNKSNFKLSLKDDYLIDDVFLTNSADNNLIITCLYSMPGRGYYTAGVFSAKVNIRENEIISETYNPFEDDFITTGLSERERMKIRKSIISGRKTPNFRKYKFNKTILLNNGSILYVMEEQIIENATSGGFHTTYTTKQTAVGGIGGISSMPVGGTAYQPSKFQYNDLILFKLNSAGEIEWKQKIHKQQVSHADRGYFSSVGTFLKGDQLFVYFNDNTGNYDENGFYLENMNRFCKTFYSSYKKVLLAEVRINLNDGTYERVSLYKSDEGLTIPKVFSYDPSQEKILILQDMKNKMEKTAFLYPEISPK